MISIDATFLIQLGFFLAFVVIVNASLFSPMRAYLARRKAAIETPRAEAARLEESAARAAQENAQRVAAVREEIAAQRAAARREALELQKKLLDESKRKAIVEVDAAEDQLAAEVAAARERMRAEVSEIATTITSKVLGRPSINLAKH